jgi:amidophosphoribosyltransferase
MCGVIGIFSSGDDAFAPAVDGLFQMQHRGQDACGLAISDGARIRQHRGLGHVRHVFAEQPYPEFAGRIACGHVRYPTQGSNRVDNAQPHVVSELEGTRLALASNGDVTNYHEVRAELEASGVAFASTNDGELILKTIAKHHLQDKLPLLDAIRAMQARVKGAYSACLITNDRLYAIRDPHAIRPLAFGRGDGFWMVASETNALDINLADWLGDLEPGEVIAFDANGIERHPHPDLASVRDGWGRSAHCVFEHVYFSRPDSIAFGERVYDVRKRIGAWLADDDPVEADVVVPVPDSSNAMALGYAQRAGLPFEFGLIRNHYVGRTFISPTQARRDAGVRRKFNPLRSVFKDKRVILVDDSIVRGTTLRKITRIVFQAGAKEVHLRIGSPVVRFSCFYGVDTPTADELIGNRLDVDAICEHVCATSLRYMTREGLHDCVGAEAPFCFACFDGQYPVPIPANKLQADQT